MGGGAGEEQARDGRTTDVVQGVDTQFRRMLSSVRRSVGVVAAGVCLQVAGGRVRVMVEAQGWARESGGGEGRFEGGRYYQCCGGLQSAATSQRRAAAHGWQSAGVERRLCCEARSTVGHRAGWHRGLFGRVRG